MIDELRLTPEVEAILFENCAREIGGMSRDDLHKVELSDDFVIPDGEDGVLLWVGKSPWSRAYEGYMNVHNAPEWLIYAFLNYFNAEWRAKQAGIVSAARRHFDVTFGLKYVIRMNEADYSGRLLSCSTYPMLGRLLARYCHEAYDARFFSLHRIPETDPVLFPDLYKKMTVTGTVSEGEVAGIDVA